MARWKICKIGNMSFIIKLFILLTCGFFLYVVYNFQAKNLMSSSNWKLQTALPNSYFISKVNQTLLEKDKLSKEVNKYNIFFIESNMKRAVISPKEMCAIESAARHNPKADVKVYTLRAQLNESARGLLTKYSNIEIIDFKPEFVFENDSKMNGFWKRGDAMRSQFAHAHLSDFIRFI